VPQRPIAGDATVTIESHSEELWWTYGMQKLRTRSSANCTAQIRSRHHRSVPWNNLPQHLTPATSLSVFRSRLNTHQLILKANSAFHPSGVGE